MFQNSAFLYAGLGIAVVVVVGAFGYCAYRDLMRNDDAPQAAAADIELGNVPRKEEQEEDKTKRKKPEAKKAPMSASSQAIVDRGKYHLSLSRVTDHFPFTAEKKENLLNLPYTNNLP